MAKGAGRKPILWQGAMVTVLVALVPCFFAGIYFFGWRALAMVAVSGVAAFVAEWLFVRTRGKPVTSAVFVTSTLLALILPPSLPLWMVAVGAVFAIVFGKMAFGGFGRNVFNPAMVGRCFLYICFPVQMTSRFWGPISGAWAGFRAWSPSMDSVTSATPLGLWRDSPGEYAFSVSNLFLGEVPGSLGETAAIPILMGACLLLWKRVANWKMMASVGLGAFAFSGLGHYVLNAEAVPGLSFTFGSGGLLFAMVFMATDPVSASKTEKGRWITGLSIGMLAVLIRSYSSFAGGVMYAVLLVNMFTPTVDLLLKRPRKSREKPPGAEGGEKA